MIEFLGALGVALLVGGAIYLFLGWLEKKTAEGPLFPEKSRSNSSFPTFLEGESRYARPRSVPTPRPSQKAAQRPARVKKEPAGAPTPPKARAYPKSTPRAKRKGH